MRRDRCRKVQDRIGNCLGEDPAAVDGVELDHGDRVEEILHGV
jgi:hypothetical protein